MSINRAVLIYLLLILQLLSRNVEAYWPNNYTIIQLINSMNTSWRAGRNPTNIPRRYPKEFPKRHPDLPTLKAVHMRSPVSFDARSKWVFCARMLSTIRHQHSCGSCWAVSVNAMLSDRICLESKGRTQVQLSVDDVITCCHSCRKKRKKKNSCRGASAYKAIKFWIKEGIVSGGELNSREGCKPYSWASSRGIHQDCEKKCTNRDYTRKYSEDKRFGKLAYQLPKGEDSIKTEIFTHGPVVCIFYLQDDFRQYRSGVYKHKVGSYQGLHGIIVIGWGEEDGLKYWLAANTWGTKFGWNSGYIKFTRGENHCEIEEHAIAGRMFNRLLTREKLILGASGLNRGHSLGTSSELLEVILFPHIEAVTFLVYFISCL